jgi:hypothetical protein
MKNLKLSLSKKLRTRIPSWQDYLYSVRQDKRQTAYKLLPLITAPKTRLRLSSAWARFKPRSNDLRLADTTKTHLQMLLTDGIVNDMPPIPPDQLRNIQNFFKSELCHDPYRPHLGKFNWDRVPSIECNMAMYTSEQIVSAPHVMQLFNSHHLLNLAEAYLGCKPTLDNIGCWWSYGERLIAKGTQQFHRDFDSIAGFKVFFYLTDVGPEQGPHEYVRGSHRDQLIDTGAAISEELLWQNYDPKRALIVAGEAGSSFIADTFGIHRGQLPKIGFRLILCAQYNLNVTPHGPKEPTIKNNGDAKFDQYINRVYLKTYS